MEQDKFSIKNELIKKVIKFEQSEIKPLIKVTSLSYVIDFGKHKGKSFENIIKTDSNYIIWLHNNTIKGIRVSQEILDLCVKYQNSTSLDSHFSFNQDSNKVNKDFINVEDCDDLPF